VSATTAGVGNVPVSIAEDVVATILSILAIVVPVVIAALIIVITSFVVWLLYRRARRLPQTPRA
jgi:predicted permease